MALKPKTARILPQTRVWIDAQASAALAEEADLRGAHRVLVFCSRTLAQKTDAIDRIKERLGARCAGVFDGLSEHTPLDAVLEAARIARSVKADLFAAVGGGSVIDGTKAVQAGLAGDLHTAQDYSDFAQKLRNRETTPDVTVRSVAVPTTLSGAEFTAGAGYTNPLSGLKEGVRKADLAPHAIVLDPALSISTPQRLWLSSGIRAVDHAVETICSPDAWPGLRAQCAAGLALLANALRRAHAQPDDIIARSEAQQAVWMVSNGLENVRTGASHGMGYLLGSLGGVPHGLTSCVLLPAVLRWNESRTSEVQAIIAAVLGAPARRAGDLIGELIADLGLPNHIDALGVSDDVLERMAALAPHHPTVRANPREIASVEDARALLASAR